MATQVTHVGVPLFTNRKGEHEVVNERINVCRRSFYKIDGVCKLDPINASKLYHSICLPRS